MPKEFPQIRLHGNKTAAVQYTKRGMLELFRAQAWKERAGVPITKRSVEVNDWTTIYVHVAEEQTFVDITCNPPVGQPIEEVVEKEEDIPLECVPGFIVRKLDPDERWATDSLNQTKYKGDGGFDGYDGYIIAYNSHNKKWYKAQYAESLGAFEGAFASGWWHLPEVAKRAYGKYRHCDVITWKGGMGGFNNTSILYSASAVNGEDKVSTKVNFSSDFFMGGKKYSAPVNALYCACIVPEPTEHRDYFYAVGVNLRTEDTYKKYVSGDSIQIWKAPVSDSPEWEIVKFIDAHDDNAGTYVRPSLPSVPDTVPMGGSGYMDAEGNAYVMREYYYERAEADHPHTQRYAWQMIKIQLRTGDHEILWDYGDHLIHWEYGWDSGFKGPFYNDAITPPPTPWTGGSSTFGRAWIDNEVFLGMFGGLQDLYTITCTFERNHSGSTQVSSTLGQRYPKPDPSPPPEFNYYYDMPGSISLQWNKSGHLTLHVYKGTDFQLHDSLQIFGESTNVSLTEDGTFAAHSERRKVGNADGNALVEEFRRHVMWYHPEIKNSWTYSEQSMAYDGRAGSGNRTLRFVQSGKQQHQFNIPCVWNARFTDGVDPLDSNFYQQGPGSDPNWRLMFKQGRDDGIWKHVTGQETLTHYATRMNSRAVSFDDHFLAWGPGAAYVWSGYGMANTYSTIESGAIVNYYGTGHPHMFQIAQPSFQTFNTDRGIYMPDVCATHREIDGKIPYLHMQRKVHVVDNPWGDQSVYPGTDTNNVFVNDTEVFCSEANPRTFAGAQHPQLQSMWDSWYQEYTPNRWVWWTKDLGNAKEGYKMEDEWEIESNFITKEEILKLIGFNDDEEADKKTGEMMFEIAVI